MRAGPRAGKVPPQHVPPGSPNASRKYTARPLTSITDWDRLGFGFQVGVSWTGWMRHVLVPMFNHWSVAPFATRISSSLIGSNTPKEAPLSPPHPVPGGGTRPAAASGPVNCLLANEKVYPPQPCTAPQPESAPWVIP